MYSNTRPAEHSKIVSVYVIPSFKFKLVLHSPKSIVAATCKYFRLNEQQFKSNRRYRPFVHARFVCAYLLRIHTDLTTSMIGSLIGDKDHTSAVYATKRIKDELSMPKLFDTESEIKTILNISLSINTKYNDTFTTSRT